MTLCWDAAFLLTVESFLLTIEFFCLGVVHWIKNFLTMLQSHEMARAGIYARLIPKTIPTGSVILELHSNTPSIIPETIPPVMRIFGNPLLTPLTEFST